MTTHFRNFMRAAAIAGAALGASAAGAATTDMFTLSGSVQQPGIYDRARLEALPAEDRNIGSDVYTGTTLGQLLNDAGIATDPAHKNDALNKLVVATGADGYKATFSLGEIHPSFGGAGQPHLVAYDINDEPLTFNGFARMISPEDNARGRFVSNLASLEVVSAPRLDMAPVGGATSSFELSGGVANPGTITTADFSGLDMMVREVSFMTGGGQRNETFTGYSLWEFLDARGILTDAGIKNDLLRKALLVTGSDGYQVAFALGELSPRFGDPSMNAMIALWDANGPLGDSGFARLVLPGDVYGGRFVSNIATMRVVDVTVPQIAPVPLPAGGVLMLTGIMAVAALRRSRRRDVA